MELELTSENQAAKQIERTEPLPALATGRKLHAPSAQTLIEQPGYADESVSTELGCGVQIVGVAPRTSSLPAMEARAATHLPDVGETVREANAKALNSPTKSAGAIVKKNDALYRMWNTEKVGFSIQPRLGSGSEYRLSIADVSYRGAPWYPGAEVPIGWAPYEF